MVTLRVLYLPLRENIQLKCIQYHFWKNYISTVLHITQIITVSLNKHYEETLIADKQSYTVIPLLITVY